MRKSRIVRTVLIGCACFAAFLYGRSSLDSVYGEKQPDDACQANEVISLDGFSESESPYFCEEASLDALQEASDIIIKGTVQKERTMRLYSTTTEVTVEEILQDKNNELQKGQTILYVEPASIVRGEVYYSKGYQLVQTGGGYILFLKHLYCPDGYSYSRQERISFMPVSNYYARYDLSGHETAEALPADGTALSYQDVRDFALLTADAKKAESYRRLRALVLEKFVTG